MQIGSLVKHYSQTGDKVHGIGVVTEIDKGGMAKVHWTKTQPTWMVAMFLRGVKCTLEH